MHRFLSWPMCWTKSRIDDTYYKLNRCGYRKAFEMQTIEQALSKLDRSRFRSGSYLTNMEKAYLDDRGMETMRRHAQDFVRQKLAPAEPVNDGKQTPMHGHPVFKAMHATACCCRG